MKITAIEVTPVCVPRLRAYGAVVRTALGPADVSEHRHRRGYAPTKGLTGLGEISSVFARRGPFLYRDVDERLAPALVGRDPLAITGALRAMETRLPDGQLAIAGVEMALWDLAGKALGLPVCTLLGGKVRERIHAQTTRYRTGSRSRWRSSRRNAPAKGFRTVKVKVGQGLERGRGGGEAGPGGGRRRASGAGGRQHGDEQRPRRPSASSSGSWTSTPRCWSSRCRLATCTRWPRIRRSVSLPIMADESIGPPRDAMEVIRREAADVLNVYVTESGGIQNAARIFTLAEQAGLGCMIGSMPELGIGTAAQIHLGMAMPNLDYDSDTCGSLYQEEDLLATPLCFERGLRLRAGRAGTGRRARPPTPSRAAARRSPPQ